MRGGLVLHDHPDHNHHHHHDNRYSDMQARVKALETVLTGRRG
jgi:nitrile hydratase